MTRIAIVTGSIRPGRQSLNVARWVESIAAQRDDATFEIVDIADFELPVWDETTPPSFGPGEKAHTRAWSQRISGYDGYVFVVSEYNHPITGALKNALDYLKPELRNKAAGFVSYGSAGGARAVEHLRTILSELQVAHVRNSVLLSLFTDFDARPAGRLDQGDGGGPGRRVHRRRGGGRLMATVVVFGGTGYAGGHIAREAVSRGHTVVSYTRNAPTEPVDESPLATYVPLLVEAAVEGGARLSFVGGAGSSLVTADVLEALRLAPAELDWFYVSPAALFGSFAPGEPTGASRTGGDVLVTREDGSSEISGAVSSRAGPARTPPGRGAGGRRRPR